jgi:hypothetical protein
MLDIVVGFVADRMRFALYVSSASSSVFLTSDLQPFGSDLDEVPRADVEESSGVPLAGNHPCFHGRTPN